MTDQIGTLETATDTDCLSMLAELFQLREPQLHRTAVALLLQANRGSLLIDVAQASNVPTAAAWMAVSEIPDLNGLNLSRLQSQRLEDKAVQLLKSDSLPLQVANVWFICRHLPQLKPRLIKCLTPLPLRTFCVLTDDEDVVPLIRHLLNGDDPLPAVIGLALSPSRLIDIFAVESAAADILAARHGYTLRVALPQAKPFMACGICHVNPSMLERIPADVRTDVDCVIEYIVAADAAFVGGSRIAPDISSLNFRNDRYAQAVLFAAVRELDFGTLQLRRNQSAFDFTLAYDSASDAARFLHLPESLLQTVCISEAVQMAQHLNVPDSAVNAFIVDYAACWLRSTKEERHCFMDLLQAKWNAGKP